MAKQVTAQIKLQVPGGAATPAPPVGPALGQHGVNIGQFVSQFNDRTKDMKGSNLTVPVVITVYSDRTFTFEVKSPPAAVLLKQAAGIPLEKKKGGEVIPAEHKKGGKYKDHKVKAADVRDIAKKKFNDLNARDLDHAVRIVEGTARSMGLMIE